MQISTGLEPVIKQLAWHPMIRSTSVNISQMQSQFEVPELALQKGQICVLELRSPVDTSEAPKGTVIHVLALTGEPTVTRRGVKYMVSSDWPEHSARIEADYRERQNIPDDAVKTEVERPFALTREVFIEWYEINA